MKTGLLHRMRRARRQMADQHRHLKAIRAELLRALAPGRAERAVEAWRQYSEAIQAHFALENETFFPALHGLRPEFSRDLGSLDREHRAFITNLATIERALSANDLDSGAVAIQALIEDLAAHEQREEALVARITADLPGAAAPIDSSAT